MPADAVIVVVLMLVVGCAAFLFGVIYLTGRLIGGAGRCMMRLVRPGRRQTPGRPLAPIQTVLVCPREQCGRTENRSDARFCSQCGTQLATLRSDRK